MRGLRESSVESGIVTGMHMDLCLFDDVHAQAFSVCNDVTKCLAAKVRLDERFCYEIMIYVNNDSVLKTNV